jgi:hypothetical protein
MGRVEPPASYDDDDVLYDYVTDEEVEVGVRWKERPFSCSRRRRGAGWDGAFSPRRSSCKGRLVAAARGGGHGLYGPGFPPPSPM